MNQQDRESVEKVFHTIFKRPVSVILESCDDENDTIVIDGGLSIRHTVSCIEVKSILGVRREDGFTVEKTVIQNNYPHAPDDADYVQVGEACRTIYQAIQLAVATYAENEAQHQIECLRFPDDAA